MIKNIIIAGGIGLSLIVGFLGLTKESTFVTRNIVGSVSSPDISSPYISWGGLVRWAYETDVTNLNDVACSFVSPSATSTLEGASINLSSIASTTVVEIGYSSTGATATTTLLAGSYTVASGSQVLVHTSTTSPAYTLAPNSRVNVKIGGASVAGTSATKFVGNCTFSARQVSGY